LKLRSKLLVLTMLISSTSLASGSQRLYCSSAASDTFTVTHENNDVTIFLASGTIESTELGQRLIRLVSSVPSDAQKTYRFFEYRFRPAAEACDFERLPALNFLCEHEAGALEVTAFEWRYQRDPGDVFTILYTAMEASSVIDDGSLVANIGFSLNSIRFQMESIHFHTEAWEYDGRRQAPECRYSL
jgi:hypothetical protein